MSLALATLLALLAAAPAICRQLMAKPWHAPGALVPGPRDTIDSGVLARAAPRAHASEPETPHDKIKNIKDVLSSFQHFEGRPVFARLQQLLSRSRFNHNAAEQQGHVVLYKTHKTGSTTLASVLFRYAARHRLRLFARSGTVINPALVQRLANTSHDTSAYSADVIFQHVSGLGIDLAFPLRTALAFYRRVVPDPHIVTLMRNPLQQSLSWLCYYALPQDIFALERRIFDATLPDNLQCHEFGARSPEELTAFIEGEMRQFELFCISEMFDECLVMMRRRYNWDMLDITYIRLLDSEENRSAQFLTE